MLSRPWQEDTVIFAASTTKVPMVIALLMVIDRGLIDLDQTVAHYWPEFAQGGKAAVTVRDVLRKSPTRSAPTFRSD